MNEANQAHRSVEYGGQATRVLEAGEGDPVVILHGWGGRIESMTPVIACLWGRFRVIALDLPGFGEAPVPKTSWGTTDYADFVRRVLDDFGVERASFVGHSFGAKVSLVLAAKAPELVDKLILVGSSGLRSAPSLKTRLKRGASKAARAAGRLGGPGRVLRDAAYRKLASSDYRDAGAMRPILVRVVNEDLTETLPAVKAPTLLVWGATDDAVPLAHARRMESLIPDAGLVVFEEAGHFAYLDDAHRFCRVAKHFLGVRSQ